MWEKIQNKGKDRRPRNRGDTQMEGAHDKRSYDIRKVMGRPKRPRDRRTNSRIGRRTQDPKGGSRRNFPRGGRCDPPPKDNADLPDFSP